MILCQGVFSFYFSTFNPSPFSSNDLNQTHRFWKYFINLDPENKRSHDPWISLPFQLPEMGGPNRYIGRFVSALKAPGHQRNQASKPGKQTNG